MRNRHLSPEGRTLRPQAAEVRACPNELLQTPSGGLHLGAPQSAFLSGLRSSRDGSNTEKHKYLTIAITHRVLPGPGTILKALHTSTHFFVCHLYDDTARSRNRFRGSMQGGRATALCVTFHDSRKPGKLPASVSRTASPRRGSGRGEMTGFSSHKRCHTLVRVQKSSVSAGGAPGCWGMKRTLSALPRPRLHAAGPAEKLPVGCSGVTPEGTSMTV